jgi:hypothetical protein
VNKKNLYDLFLSRSFKDSVKNVEFAILIPFALKDCTVDNYSKDSLFLFFRYFEKVWKFETSDSFSENQLGELEQYDLELTIFLHNVKFIDSICRMRKHWKSLRERADMSSNTSKFHDCVHRTQRIQMFGNTNIQCTRTFERFHSPVVKQGIKHTNHKNVLSQLVDQVNQIFFFSNFNKFIRVSKDFYPPLS